MKRADRATEVPRAALRLRAEKIVVRSIEPTSPLSTQEWEAGMLLDVSDERLRSAYVVQIPDVPVLKHLSIWHQL